MTPYSYYRSSKPFGIDPERTMYTFDQHEGAERGTGTNMLARLTVKGHGEELHPCVRD